MIRNFVLLWFVASVAIGFFTMIGCDSKPQRSAEVVPASGVVTMNGQPLAGAAVTFHPASGNGGGGAPGSKPAARAKTDAEGRFRLWTFDENDGAVPGEHKVTINKVEMTAPDVDPDAPDYNPKREAPEPKVTYIVLEKFGNPQTSGLTATVNPDGPNDDLRFDL
jgi:hypothetical protein